MLSVDHLSFSYKTTPVLKDINFNLEKGELGGLFGPNGTGKTTLFKCCLKLLKPHGGSIRFDGKPIGTMNARQMAKTVAYVPQSHHSPFAFSAGEMVLMGRTPHMSRFFSPGTADQKKALRAMDDIGIRHLAQLPYNRLSGGQQQMVLIARAIAQETRLILLDEPAAALDFKNQMVLWKTLRRIAETGTTILACSHDPNHVAWFCHKTVVLGPSGILAQGDPSSVLSQELMDEIYQDACRVKSLDGIKMILPRGITPDDGKIVAFPGKQKGRQHS